MSPVRRGEPIEARSWSHKLTQQVGREVERHRRRQGLKILDLVERCEALGHPMPRMTIANLESGKRESVSLAEILVLAQALEVFPVALMVPLESPDPIEVSPGRTMYAGPAVMWLIGSVSDDEAAGRMGKDPTYELLYWLRQYEAAVRDAARDYQQLQEPNVYQVWDEERQELVRKTLTDRDRTPEVQARFEASIKSLDYARRVLIGLGVTPRPLPPELAAAEVMSPVEQWMVDRVTVRPT